MKENKAARHAHRNGASMASLGLALLGLPALVGMTVTGAAQAQAPAPASSASATSDEVVVTGSRIARSGFETPTPLTSISPQEMALKAPSTFVNMLTEIPQLIPNQATARATDVGASNVNLRNLGADRNLILLDGRRLAPTSPFGGIDINVLPAPLINRVEIVTGGASAAYGSDAISGVMNIFLDSKMTGLKAEAQAGQTTHGDKQEYSLSLAYGTQFANERGHVVAAIGKYATEGVLSQYEREWGLENYGSLANPAWTPTNGQVRRFIVPDVCSARMTDGGVIAGATGLTAANSAQVVNTQFGVNGAQSRFNVGAAANTNHAIGGDGACFGEFAVIAPEVERQNAFTRATFDLTDWLTGWGEALYAKSEQRYPISPNYDNGATGSILTIRKGNPFIPTNIDALMPAGSTLLVGRTNKDGGFNDYVGTNEVQRYAAGLDGKVGNWDWDVAAQYSENNYEVITSNNRNQNKYRFAADAVRNTAGSIVCAINANASTADDDPACVPFNPFGLNNMTAGTLAYISGTSTVNAVQYQSNVSANIRGEPISTWAGPVSVALGGEYRRDQIKQTVDAGSIAQQWRANQSLPFQGRNEVSEFYFETVVPLLNDVALAKNLEFNGAARSTNYANSGVVQTWKMGLNYTPFDDLRLRATRSHDIRAPSINELYTQGTLRTGINLDRTELQVGLPPVTITSLSQGNATLTPEIGDTITYGFIYQPSWFEGFRASVDVYEIEIADAIVATGSQDAWNRCIRGETNFCSGIVGPINQPTRVDTLSYNAQKIQTSGVDFELAYRFDASRVVSSWPGTFTIRQLATFVDEFLTINQPNISYSDGNVGNPHWRGTTSFVYASDKFSARLSGYFIGGGKRDNDLTDQELPNNQVAPEIYLNTSASYDFTEKFQVFGRIDNLMDRDPPPTPGTLIINNQAGSGLYDKIGRAFTIGLRYKM